MKKVMNTIPLTYHLASRDPGVSLYDGIRHDLSIDHSTDMAHLCVQHGDDNDG